MDLNNITAFLAIILWPSAGSKILTSVDPPTDLQVTDLGHLGPLHIHWKAPLSLTNKKLCGVRYMMSHCNVDSTNCKHVTTKKLEYTDGFNLNEGIEVKIQTLVKEQCINGTELHSDWVEIVYWPPMEGPVGSKIRDLQCIVYNLEYMDCKWQNGMSAPHDINYTLYYWHEELEQTMECDNYIKNQGNIVGCHFHSDDLIEFSDFNICINGSSAMGPVRPAYYTLQLQDLVKVAAPNQVSLTSSRTDTIYIQWEPPAGKMKLHCMKYEVQFCGKSSDWESKVIPEPVTSTSLNVTAKTMYCVRVRAAVNMFCADDSFWSDWSSIQCLTEHSESGDDVIIKLNFLTELIALLTLASFTLVLCVVALYFWIRWKRLIAKKKLNMLLNDDVKNIQKNTHLNY
ncbi:interleukin-13 receptor subunit alpha-2-like isoform X2 [Carcharodon carcharias]|uniref:interleukin-13 receptor subunit alpha-2-like isoform X2 n=1 Tax=Carcharodon carcharias TaxID=13397 RepID=UPI001B7E370E|nr:interleukin-13 receptor subunit alpha-2-like isoform X2 [Carcharodon carcharias]